MRRIAIAVLVALLVVANVLTPFKVEQVRIRLEPEVIFGIGSFGVTNTLITGILAAAALILLGRLATRRLEDVPRPHSLQNAIEAAFEVLYGYVQSFAGERASAFFPMLACFFLYILLSNWLALLPGVGSIIVWSGAGAEREAAPLLRGATSDLNATLALAVISVVSSQVFGVRFRGLWGHLSRYVAINRFITFFRELFRGKRPSPGMLARGLLDLFIGMLEVFEELTQVLSFSFRLFGNIFGGEVLLLVMAFLAPYVASLPFMGVEMLGGLIQAFIFCVLSAAFFARSAASHDESTAHDDDAPGATAPERLTLSA
jgi:F-type H+-transporting ATPase subunit a